MDCGHGEGGLRVSSLGRGAAYDLLEEQQVRGGGPRVFVGGAQQVGEFGMHRTRE